jgi:hypothetical protein
VARVLFFFELAWHAHHQKLTPSSKGIAWRARWNGRGTPQYLLLALAWHALGLAWHAIKQNRIPFLRCNCVARVGLAWHASCFFLSLRVARVEVGVARCRHIIEFPYLLELCGTRYRRRGTPEYVFLPVRGTRRTGVARPSPGTNSLLFLQLRGTR